MPELLFIPEIVDQYWENAASLWLIRDNAVGRSALRLVDLIKLDERVEANIDGLRIAQMSGWSAPLDELDGGGAGEFYAAGVLALESGSSDQLDRVVECAYRRTAENAGDPYHPAYDPWRGLVSALAWVEHTYSAGAIERLLDTPRPRTRWLGIAACGARRRSRQRDLEAALSDAEPLVRARAARVAGEQGRADLQAKLNALLVDSDEDCRFWAAWSACLLGTAEGLRALAGFARSSDRWRGRALDLLLRRLPIKRAHAFVQPLASDPRNRRAVIRAAGVIGDPAYVPWLIGQTCDPAVARTAGTAFATVTGADLSKLDRPPPADDEAGPPNDDSDDADVALAQDEGLPVPDPEKLNQWWKANTSRFHAGIPYFLGAPKDAGNWIEFLFNAVQRDRWAAALELALRRPGQAMLEVRARGDVQQRLLEDAQSE